jgi:hypothetical protein
MCPKRWRIGVGTCLTFMLVTSALPYTHADAHHVNAHQPVRKTGACGVAVVGQAVAPTPGGGPTSTPHPTPRPAKLTPTPTHTSVPTPTATGTRTPAPVQPTPTSTPAVVPFVTPTPQLQQPSTATLTPSPMPAPILTPTQASVVIVLPTASNTPNPNATSSLPSTIGPEVTPTTPSVALPTPTPQPTSTLSPTDTATPVSSDTPTPPATPIPSDTPTPPATPIPSDTPMPPATPIPSDTPMPPATPIPSDTPVSPPTDTPIPTPSDTAVPTDTETPTATDVQRTPKPTKTPRITISSNKPGGAVIQWAGSPNTSRLGVEARTSATKGSVSPGIVCVWTSADNAGKPAAVFPPKAPVRLLAAWRVVRRAHLEQYRLHIHWDVYKDYQADVSLLPLQGLRVAWREAPVPTTLEPGTFRLTFLPAINHLARGWYALVARTSFFGPGCPGSGCKGTARQTRFYHY